MTDFAIACEACGQTLIESRIVWLELDQRTNTFHDFGGIPTDSNQGGFPFGAACAQKERRKSRAAIAKARGE